MSVRTSFYSAVYAYNNQSNVDYVLENRDCEQTSFPDYIS